MKVYLLDNKKINMYPLPRKIEDPYLINYITDDGLEESINLIAKDGHWEIDSSPETIFINDGKRVNNEILVNNSTYQVAFSDVREPLMFYCFDTPVNYTEYDLSGVNEVIIGKDQSNTIFYDNQYTNAQAIRITKQNDYWILDDYGNDQPIYINGLREKSKVLKLGDTIFINGLKIIWLHRLIKVNTPKDKIAIRLNPSKELSIDNKKYSEPSDTEKASTLYNDNQVFFHTPRLKESIKEKEIRIELPPSKREPDKTPVILQLGGTIMMGMASCITGIIAIFNVAGGKESLLSSLTEIIMCLSMVLGTILLPISLDKYQKATVKKEEQKRQKKYSEYLAEKEIEIEKSINKERQILLENNLSIDELQQELINRTNKIWSREIKDSDFLSMRLGLGNLKPRFTVTANLEEFSLEDDNLKNKVKEIVNKKIMLENIPITASLIEDKILPVIISNNYPKKQQFIDSLMLQIISYYSGVDLKIAVVTTEENKKNWEYLKYLPHCSSENHKVHFFASNEEEEKQLLNYLDKERQERIKSEDNEQNKEDKDSKNQLNANEIYKKHETYYLLVTDNFISTKKYEFVDSIINTESNYGFSILMFEENMKNIPSSCEHFIDINETSSGLFSKDLSEENQKVFIPEFQERNNNKEYSEILANIPVLGSSVSNVLPSSLSFLEMYKVGKIEQLNIVNRWMNNNPTQTLEAPLGVHPDGKLFELDLHEKAHGPHGLVAGATGSGKSEFIITYILSMAVNYHPYEVQFVLIDYKGGGLAGAFENKDTGLKLPHLAGTITNLDKAEMNRTLVSIKSELQRRQKKFNEARDALNESTIDIYKYQRFFREGKVKEPISHLFIISDEFAELKSQQPEFMEELISTARIGRSLGVHLILATQKPAGVVDDQIWSNSRFKICLKVQSEEDSVELLKRPEAATIKEAGRFYLQVGYDEIFEIGQSAWCGAKYNPTERILKSYDDDIIFIDNNGNVIKKTNDKIDSNTQVDNGEQLTNIVKTLFEIAQRDNINPKPLWLPSLNPVIYIADLVRKYNYKSESYNLDILVGEYDIPANQFQDKLTVNLTTCGNIIMYGMPGSGKENFLTTLIYTTCIMHTSDEVNFYILDFGAEVLSSFAKMPQVGDVVTVMEKDKIRNHFISIERELNKRKELFKEYNGNYESYIKQSNNKIPLIVNIVNNFESFMENYSDYDDILTHQLRDCAKYGIIYITSVVSTNAIRDAVTQLYTTKLATQLNNTFDYSYMLDAKDNLIPAKHFGRGLIKLESGTYEFQTALIYEKEKINDAIKETAIKLSETSMKKAPKIPNVPKTIKYETVMSSIKELDAVPIGLNVKTSETATLDILNNKISFICGNQINVEPNYLIELIKVLTAIPSAKLKVIDLADNLSEAEVEEYYNGEFTQVISSILTAEEETKQKIVYIITGIGYIYDRVLDEGIETLFKIFNNEYKLENSFFILSDNYTSMKRLENETWYTNMNNKNGIWINQGIANQNIIKINDLKVYDANEEFNGLSYNIKNGEYEVIKIIGTIAEEDGDSY